MADIPIKFYKSIVRSQKFNPSNPPDLEDPAPVVNPPGTVPTTLYKLLGDVTDSSFIGKNGYVPVVAGENVLTLQNLDDKYVTIATAQTITGAKIFENILSLSSSASNRDKLRILSGSPDWIIGIQALTTYGRLNNTAITFQVPNVNAQGWWWGDASHTTAQGAMALTNQGDVTIARSIRVGGGESDVSKPISFNLDVQGSAFLGDAIVQGNLRLNSLVSGTGDVLLINGSNDVVRGTAGSSKWTDIGSDIYRNSRVLVGGTAFSSTIPKFEVIGGDAFINGVRVGRGGGNRDTNTANGYQALLSNTIGDYNVANGFNALRGNTTGSYNTANGTNALFANTTGNRNTANGYQALLANTTGYHNTANGDSALLWNTTGFNNIANGYESGAYIANKSTAATILNNSVMIGWRTSPLADNQTNQIVIGYDAIGAGSNTATLGNTSIIKTILRGTINMAGLPTSSSGLVTGDIWNNGGVLNIV